MKPVATEYLNDTADLFRKARGMVINGIPRLYKIREEGLWESRCSSFGEFVESLCNLDPTQVSRWLTSWEHYVIQGGIEPAKLSAANPEKLYAARKLDGTPEQQLTKALTLSKSELKQENSEESCDEHQWLTICSHCHIKKP